MGAVKQFDSLNTSYVNLSGLIRHLREQEFAGSIHLVLNQYEAEVRLNGKGEAAVSEIDPATRTASQSQGAMERMLVHAREPGGTIIVYEEGAAEVNSEEGIKSTASSAEGDDGVTAPSPFQSPFPPATAPPPEAPDTIDWEDLLEVGSKLIASVEWAVQSLGADFESDFRLARTELGDDYPFLDPTGNGLTYVNKAIKLRDQPSRNAFVTGLSECLRRIVNKRANGKQGKRFRESVAIELAVASRMRPRGMGKFTAQLDRIAGTRVL
jgi:hypothetical protein